MRMQWACSGSLQTVPTDVLIPTPREGGKRLRIRIYRKRYPKLTQLKLPVEIVLEFIFNPLFNSFCCIN